MALSIDKAGYLSVLNDICLSYGVVILTSLVTNAINPAGVVNALDLWMGWRVLCPLTTADAAAAYDGNCA